MRYEKIDKNLFVENRKNFVKRMSDHAIAILSSNDVMPTNADGDLEFVQNNDLFYLSGIDQEETVLLIYPDAYNEAYREVLFIKKTDALMRQWDGDKLSPEEATEISGIQNVLWLDDFEKYLQLFAFEADTFYLGHNEHIKRMTKDMTTREDRMIQWIRQKYPLHKLDRVAKITRHLRPVKSKYEIDLIKKAAEISALAYDRVRKAIKPGIKEYELEAELVYALTKSGGNRHAFKPIVASGKNACALHYNNNDDICKDGALLLLDFGVNYANYNSDITRCLPVNGKFTARQEAVYRSVKHCLLEGSKLLRAGTVHKEYESKMAKLVEEQLVELKLLDATEVSNQDPAKPLYKKYFMHGTAHFLGLDVHDVGLYSRPMEAGMVFTCEPGIYIPEEGIGCRLENDYLITPGEPENLTEAIPLEF
ncbi:MAG: aminopeptidase P N-terminal domain-containing protein [Saprospiraceae bacterium]|nr:aminopeptidase P N-terminal domain-containing protein [Saprospiraceae bacterium]MCB9322232.1 aminopeptidase P N-terminal domain-containing protein [Lewinellaceae bacterium]